mmetsp:Transcript_34026/g.74971  ORF Transcript_34026/g.74971 Transcript_34026/m.74971 type:complete len:268 (-) Transcript_34026:199-1002(-)
MRGVRQHIHLQSACPLVALQAAQFLLKDQGHRQHVRVPVPSQHLRRLPCHPQRLHLNSAPRPQEVSAAHVHQVQHALGSQEPVVRKHRSLARVPLARPQGQPGAGAGQRHLLEGDVLLEQLGALAARDARYELEGAQKHVLLGDGEVSAQAAVQQLLHLRELCLDQVQVRLQQLLVHHGQVPRQVERSLVVLHGLVFELPQQMQVAVSIAQAFEGRDSHARALSEGPLDNARCVCHGHPAGHCPRGVNRSDVVDLWICGGEDGDIRV